MWKQDVQKPIGIQVTVEYSEIGISALEIKFQV